MSKSSNGKNAQKKTYQLRFEQYLREHVKVTVEAGSLAEAVQIARNMTREEINRLYFDFSVPFEDVTTLYSISSEYGEQLLSVSDVEDDCTKILHIEAGSLINDRYGDRIQQASDIERAGNGDGAALTRLLGVTASLICKTTTDLVWLLRIAHCLRIANGTPSPEQASSWLVHLGTLGRLRAEHGGDLPGELQGKEDLIAWMKSMAEKVALSAWIPIDGTSSRRSGNL